MIQWVAITAGVAVLAAAIWRLICWLRLPIFPRQTVTICYVSGNGAELEHLVRSYGLLQGEGRLILADCGLTAEGLTAAQLLQKHHAWVTYCPRQTLTDYLELSEDRI